MSNAMYKVGTVARIAMVTVRTLHHYDAIDLLTPSGYSESGYRLYTDEDVRRLQQIRFHRELGMALEKIREILDSPDFDTHAALRKHRQQLVERVHDTEALVATIDRMLEDLDGGRTMATEELFDGFRQEEYQAESKKRWGETGAWKESQRRVASYDDDDWHTINAEAESIVTALAELHETDHPANSEAAMDAAEQHRLHIDRWYYACSPTMHAALAQMYVSDPRFADYFDKHGEGLSAYVAEAIRANAARP